MVVPHLPGGRSPEWVEAAQRDLLLDLVERHGIESPILWLYTPMALPFIEGIEPSAVVYDCMDELSLFRGAPPALLERERRLLEIADLVFTGGQSLYESKREQHPRVYPFPSSIDAAHFGQARQPQDEPADQAGIAHPRLGYFGVIDERIDSTSSWGWPRPGRTGRSSSSARWSRSIPPPCRGAPTSTTWG